MTDFIPDLKQMVSAGRIEDAKLALAGLEQRPETDHQAVLEILALAPDKTALELLPFLLAQINPDHPVRHRLFQLTTDRAHLNYVFVLILMDHATPGQLTQIVPLLKHILSRETKGDFLNQMLRAVGKLKIEALVGDVAEFIFFDDTGLKQEAIKALERIRTPKALECLEQVAKTDKCDPDVLDAIDMLREGLSKTRDMTPEKLAPPTQSQLEKHVDLLSGKRMEDRLTAYDYFSDQGARVAQALHENLDTENKALLINLLRLAARTIPQEALGDLLTLAARKDIENPIKFLIYTTLTQFPTLESAASILNAVTDPAMYIRMAAVKILDRHCSDYIIAEIKKKIESGTKVGETLGVTILDAKAEHLIDALMNSDTFSYISSNYLERSAPAQVIDAYINVLEKRQRRSTIKKYTRFRLERAKQEAPFFVVINPSTTVLDVYAKLIHGCGFHARTFTGPQEAFESIVFEKPAAVICDLFIRQFTVLDLAGEIRELYHMDEVPIIVSSLQRGLDPIYLEQQFKKAGINGFCPFPAKPSQIKSWAG